MHNLKRKILFAIRSRYGEHIRVGDLATIHLGELHDLLDSDITAEQMNLVLSTLAEDGHLKVEHQILHVCGDVLDTAWDPQDLDEEISTCLGCNHWVEDDEVSREQVYHLIGRDETKTIVSCIDSRSGFPVEIRNAPHRLIYDEWALDVNAHLLRDSIVYALASSTLPFTGAHLRFSRLVLGQSVEDVAAVLDGVSPTSLQEWESDLEDVTGLTDYAQTQIRAWLFRYLKDLDPETRPYEGTLDVRILEEPS